VKGRPLIVGGVEISYDKGLAGHSDADVLIHAIIDALLGASALGDIGQHFSDTSSEFKDIDSRILLRKTTELLREKQFQISNIDSTVVAERPKLASYIKKMRSCISEDLEIGIDQVSVKATTSEGMGFEGKGNGVSARAVALINKK
jgi:2-C-methyl-D-erythritol 2,4-cyclodiphosphate synthase